jgi:hypothetical protein
MMFEGIKPFLLVFMGVEESIWSALLGDFQKLHAAKAQTELQIAKLNKSHSKIETRAATKEDFPQKAAVRLQEIYKNATSIAEREILFSFAYSVY